MKTGLKEVLESQGYKNLKKRMLIAIIILFIAFIIFAGFLLFFYYRECGNQDCFTKALAQCKKASWIREDSKAAWQYKIMGNSEKDACSVKVRLLKMNQGTIDIEKLQGDEMTCSVLKNYDKFPEEDMEKCTGILKEQLQGIIIERMHSYLLKNLGEIKEGFEV